MQLLVVDDDSPDGTGRVADELAAHEPWVQVLHRTTKAGLGAAYIAGFGWAREHDVDVVVEMDADGSHAPEQLLRLLAALEHADVVLGSRWVPGGRVVDWPRSRVLLSRGGNAWTRLMLGLPLADATGGFRAYRREVLERPAAGPGRLAGLLLPGRPGVAGLAGRRPGGRGADHLRRAPARAQQDEPADRRGGAVAGDLVGADQPAVAPAAGTPGGAALMPALLLLGLVVVPLVELYVIIQVGQQIGALWTVGLLLVVSVLGTMLLRREGSRAWRSFRAATMNGRVPGREVADGAMVLLAGALLLTPGFVTDAVGLLLLVPPVRAVLRRVLTAYASRRLLPGGPPAPGPGRVVEGEILDDP